MFKSLLGCCSSRDPATRPNTEPVPDDKTEKSLTYIQQIDSISDLLRLKRSNGQMTFSKLVRKIVNNTYDT